MPNYRNKLTKAQVAEIMHKNGFTASGLPLKRLHSIHCADGTIFEIIPSLDPYDRICTTYANDGYHVILADYAVIKKSPDDEVFYKVSNWYKRYGSAVRKMGILASEH